MFISLRFTLISGLLYRVIVHKSLLRLAHINALFNHRCILVSLGRGNKVLEVLNLRPMFGFLNLLVLVMNKPSFTTVQILLSLRLVVLLDKHILVSRAPSLSNNILLRNIVIMTVI